MEHWEPADPQLRLVCRSGLEKPLQTPGVQPAELLVPPSKRSFCERRIPCLSVSFLLPGEGVRRPIMDGGLYESKRVPDEGCSRCGCWSPGDQAAVRFDERSTWTEVPSQRYGHDRQNRYQDQPACDGYRDERIQPYLATE